MIYREATLEDLENVWNKDIRAHPNDERWVKWKQEYINYNKDGDLKTFVAVTDEHNVIAQISVVFSSKVKCVQGKKKLCDNEHICNMNAFRCDKEYEGNGHISKLVKMGEEYARQKGYKNITIGSEARETRNLSIYFHFGYRTFLMCEIDEGEEDKPLVLYYGKDL